MLPRPASAYVRSWNRGSEYECTFRTEGREQSRCLLSRWPHTADSCTARTPLSARVADLTLRTRDTTVLSHLHTVGNIDNYK